MAVLRLENETTYTEQSEIASHLAPLKIQLHRWPEIAPACRVYWHKQVSVKRKKPKC